MSAIKTGVWMALTGAGLIGSANGVCADGKDDGQIEEVQVTATRRSENLQDVPIAVTAISAQEFTDSNYKNPTDLQYLSPSVQVSASGGIGFNVRGVGTNSFNVATEQTVGLVVDGVVYGFVDDIGGDLGDVSQIEVLRGPQGTQFGKNASGGVVSITTEKPSVDAASLKLHAAYGSYDDTNANIRGNLPLSSTLATSVDVSYQNRDGWSWDPVRDQYLGGFHQFGIKGKLLWTPTDDFSAYLINDYHRGVLTPNFLSTYRVLGVGAGSIPPGFGVLDYGVTPGSENTWTGISSYSFRVTEISGSSLQLDEKLGDYTLTSLTAFRHLHRPVYATLGGTPIVYAEGASDEVGNQFSQELRLTTPDDRPVQSVMGLYYYRRSTQDAGITAGPFGGLAEALYGPGARISFSGGEDHTFYQVDSLAGFADGTVKITDGLDLIAGARETYDHAESTLYTTPVDDVYPLGTAINGPGSASTYHTNFSYRAGLRYRFTPDLMAYFTAARGYKGPLAIAVAGEGASIVKPETVQSYELGLKSALFNHSLTVDGALFDEKFHDFQTSVLDTQVAPPSFELGNAGGLRSRGVELEVTDKPLESLTVSSRLTYLDAVFTDFKTSCYSNDEPIKLASTTDPNAVGACYTIPGTTTSYTQAAGKPLPNASKWNVTADLNYVRPLSATLQFDGSANYLWRSAFYTNGADPNTRISGYGIVNMNLGVGSQDGRWRVGVFARNLFNRYYISAIETGIFDTGGLVNVLNPEARRTIGVMLDASL